MISLGKRIVIGLLLIMLILMLYHHNNNTSYFQGYNNFCNTNFDLSSLKKIYKPSNFTLNSNPSSGVNINLYRINNSRAILKIDLDTKLTYIPILTDINMFVCRGFKYKLNSENFHLTYVSKSGNITSSLSLATSNNACYQTYINKQTSGSATGSLILEAEVPLTGSIEIYLNGDF